MTADAGIVLLLLALIWAAVLIAPAAGARAEREAEFLGSIRPDGHPHDVGALTGEMPAVGEARFRPALSANARRRQVLGGLLFAIAATLVLGLVPSFRLLLVVHLLLVNSCLAYVGLLVHVRDEQAARSRVAAKAAWRSDRSPSETGFDEPVHPYAYGSGAAEEYEYGDELAYEDEVPYPVEVASHTYASDGYAYASEGDAYASDGYAYAADGYSSNGDAYAESSEDEGAYRAGERVPDDGWDDDDEAVAAYLDEELALRRPA